MLSLALSLSGRSRVISYHLQDICRHLITVGYNCYRRNNHVLMNKKETGRDCDREAQGMEVLVPIYPHLCQLRTDSLSG